MPKNISIPKLPTILKSDKKYIEESTKYIEKHFANNCGNCGNFISFRI